MGWTGREQAEGYFEGLVHFHYMEKISIGAGFSETVHTTIKCSVMSQR